ncbi:MAG: site-specific DNA-methyltransferase [Clostridiales Family XIII bacterium]|jgi:site-specific DNA-methyltransferase (adenine-specific)|nr:site-specific DNA-methyltransferase [Clostridiales Family XIII bacterium]
MIDQIICGDSIHMMAQLEDALAHAIISDIPYGINCDEWDVLHNNTNTALGGSSAAQKESGGIYKRRGKPLNGWSTADKNIPKEYQGWCASWANDWLRVLKPGGTCFVFAGRRYAHRCIVALEDAGFIFKDMIAWEKNTAAHRAQRLSAIYERRGDDFNNAKWKGWRVANLQPLFEPVLWFQKPYRIGGTIADNVLENGIGAWNEKAMQKYNISHSSGALSCANIIQVPTSSEDRGSHIAQKPLELMKCLIELVTIEGQIIVDPFAGSGTTCVAAKQLNRHYIGFEISNDTCEIAKQRIDEPYQSQLAMDMKI